MTKREQCIKAQKEYCAKNDLPIFAPSDGYCWYCYRDIYGIRGIQLNGASNGMITCCPFCGRSFID